MSRPSALNGTAPVRHDLRNRETLCAQVRLLYAGSSVAASATILAASLLAYLEWDTVPRALVLGWWIYVVLVAASRSILALNYRRASQGGAESVEWNIRFAVGAGLAGIGWGAAGYILYQEAYLPQHLFVIFVLGGMMLGAASLLAPRPEAFLAFMIPTGLGPINSTWSWAFCPGPLRSQPC